VTPLYPQKLALTSPTGGGRSVGIVRSRTKATEFFLLRILRMWLFSQKDRLLLSKCLWTQKTVPSCTAVVHF